jgi:hypothetical protein
LAGISFDDLVHNTLVDNTELYGGGAGTDVNAFWLARMQSIDNSNTADLSVKIGGANGGEVPEPGALALLGLGTLKRRRKAV